MVQVYIYVLGQTLPVVTVRAGQGEQQVNAASGQRGFVEGQGCGRGHGSICCLYLALTLKDFAGSCIRALIFTNFKVLFSFLPFFLLYLKQGFTMQPLRSRNSLASNSQISACLCLLSSRTKGIHYRAHFLLDSQYSSLNPEASQYFKATEPPPLSHLSLESLLVLELDPNFHISWSLLFLLASIFFSVLFIPHTMSFTA